MDKIIENGEMKWFKKMKKWKNEKIKKWNKLNK
jgi:hypothetical protein